MRTLGRRAFGFEADLGDRAEATAAIRQAVAELGGLDILVDVAGGAITNMETSFASTLWPHPAAGALVLSEYVLLRV